MIESKYNSTKTKEMIIGPLTKLNLPSLATPSGTIKRVSSFKLLGVPHSTPLHLQGGPLSHSAKAT